MQEVAHASRLALAFALAVASPAVPAVVLGEVETRSALGETLDARIPFSIPAGSSVDASCFALVRDPGDGSRSLGEGVLTIERRRGEAALRIRTLAPVFEPALSLRVRAACAGSEGAGTRQYSLLLDPRPGSAVTVAVPVTAAAPVTAASLNAREGDTLESMARMVHPRNTDARVRYLAALRTLNPQFAAQGEGAPIPAGTAIALPDLRTLPARVPATRFSRTPAPPREPAVPGAATEAAQRPRVSEPAASESAAAPRSVAPKREPAASKAPRASEQRLATAPAVPVAPRPERRPAAEPRVAPSSGFVLKLSSSEVDLSRSRQIDDRMRAQLRERLLVLDADDQVAAMLSMRNSLRQLEARVAEMQLKLDAMPASLAARGMPMPAVPSPAAAPTRQAPAVAPQQPPKAPPPEVRVETPVAKIDPPVPVVEPLPRVEPSIAKVEPPPPRPEPVAAKPEPSPAKPAAPPELRPGTRPIARTAPPADEGLPEWVWAVVALLLAMALFIGWRLHRRRRLPPANPWNTQAQAEPVEPTVQSPAFVEEPIEVAPEVRPELASDAVLATRLPDNASELRRRYIEERFPEIQNRTIALENPASVIKAARLFYEDGAVTRAAELLQFAVDENAGEVRPWLALFEIFRLERLTGEFEALAGRFREHHGKGAHWRKVQFFGREIDPGNALYREEAVNTLETIGPREAKRLAAGLSIVSAANFDPIAENWLDAPMDFEDQVLANELRRKLMAEASLTETDLAPNPMPALRSVEMFNLA